MTSYSFASRCFHWLTAVLVLAAFVLSVGGPETRVFGEANKSLLVLHESLGLAVFATTALRLAHRRWAALYHHFILRDGVLRAMLVSR